MDKKKLRAIIISSVAATTFIVVLIVWILVLRPSKLETVPDLSEEILDELQDNAEDMEIVSKSLIDGNEIAKSEENMIAVVVENHVDSRKQMFGLFDASLVFEMEAEGGITRFLAFYPYQDTEKVGPVRSIRPYFVRWAEMFDTALAHAGASDMGYSAIYSSGRIFDLDGLALEGGLKYFTRDYMYYAPHNLYGNLEELRELMNNRGWEKPVEEEFLKFGDLGENKLLDSEIETAETVYIYYPSSSYFVRYEYDPKSENYLRYQAGDPHIDNLNGKQIEASNVVVMVTNYYPTDNVGRLYMQTEGRGDMYLFRNGKVLNGVWNRVMSQDKIRFYDESGEELVFQEGKTWISIVNYQGGLQWE